MERKGIGEQYDPVEVAIAELQGPVDPDHEATIRREFKPPFIRDQRVGEGNNDRFPERVTIERRPDQLGIGSVQVRQVKP